MYEAMMRKVFGFNQIIHEADEENDYLQTNLIIGNLKFESARENEILKKQYNVFFNVLVKMQAGQPLYVFWKLRNSYLTPPTRSDLESVFAPYYLYFAVMLGEMLPLPISFPKYTKNLWEVNLYWGFETTPDFHELRQIHRSR